VLGFSQAIKDHYQGESCWLNTENAMVMPTEIIVNGCKGLTFQTYHGINVLIWDCGDYVIYLSGYNIGQNELILAAETVQKVE